MTKSRISAAALVAVLTAGALATPALAIGDKGFDADYYLTQLRYDGVNAIAVDDVTGDMFRATVIGADGHHFFEFFDKDSLQPIKR